MNKYDENGYIVLYEAPLIEKPEFRLYYDEDGNVITYTCEKLEGNYILVDSSAFAACRYDVVVIDGQIKQKTYKQKMVKLSPSIDGQACARDDVTIVVSDDFVNKKYWKMKTYE